MSDIKSLVASITSSSEALGPKPSNRDRKALIRLAQKLSLALETPMETVIRMTWADRARDACIQIGIKIDLFQRLSSTTPKSCSQLAEETGTDVLLLRRILRHLAAMDYLQETAVDTYAHTKFSQALTEPTIGDAFPHFLNTVDLSYMNLPNYLELNHFRNPSDSTHTSFSHAHGTKEPYFDFVLKDPSRKRRFNNHMKGYTKDRKSWQDESEGGYPIAEKLLHGADPNGVLFVDIGGNTGRDVNAFHTKYGGKCILQDLPEVISAAQPIEGVELQTHDMFTPQPVHGARAYYLHSVLHDWDDKTCVLILQNLIPAMKPGYSKILINDYVIPDRNAYWMTTGLDILMMNVLSACERSERDWLDIVAAAGGGLKISGIYTHEEGDQSLIEVELVD